MNRSGFPTRRHARIGSVTRRDNHSSVVAGQGTRIEPAPVTSTNVASIPVASTPVTSTNVASIPVIHVGVHLIIGFVLGGFITATLHYLSGWPGRDSWGFVVVGALLTPVTIGIRLRSDWLMRLASWFSEDRRVQPLQSS